MADIQCAGRTGLLAFPGKRRLAAPVLLLVVCLCGMALISAPGVSRATDAGDQEGNGRVHGARIGHRRQPLGERALLRRWRARKGAISP